MTRSCTKLILDTPVQDLKGIGPKKAQALKQAGFFSLLDLLRISPIRYQDRSQIVPLCRLLPDNTAQGLFKAKLKALKSFRIRRGLAIINATFYDSSTEVKARWFNKTYLTRQLKVENEYWLFGPAVEMKGQPVLSNPEIEPVKDEELQQQNLTPVYPSKSALSQAKISPLALRKLITRILAEIDWPGSFPVFSADSPFPAIANAFKNLHFPAEEKQAKKAEFTMAFFDQVLFQIGVLQRRKHLTGTLSLPDKNKTDKNNLDYELPFNLTNSQIKTINEILGDIESARHPMNRLLQGDVGCGKTLVAFITMLEHFKKHGHQTQIAFMAPTEVLARQQLATFKNFFTEFANKTAILTGSQKTAERNEINRQIKEGELNFIFGTHALFQDKVVFKNLSYCIVDEQQRFGVNHRRSFYRKGFNPHQLLLSATPIPRTLSLTIFGDMETSIIDELPPGRKPVETSIISDLAKTRNKIDQTLADHNKVYLVCPLIEFSEKFERTSVQEAFELISQMFPEANIKTLTGQQNWQEKELIMKTFKEGQIDILISTTVIEVGVDHPDATLMIIENAHGFGLSQLHQLRGRVGRSEKDSECILVSHMAESSNRLKILCQCHDGFELAMYDLKLRGPGDLVGTRQSGLSHPCFSHKITAGMIENARKRAFEILTIEKPSTRDWFKEKMIASFGDTYKTFMEGG
ncbi:MAG: ATP-dependent DNA helicase RecG [Candidatus Rifleibacteriota bacterium]